MEITVPLTVRVEDWMDVDGWEAAIVRDGRTAMRQALQALVTAWEALPVGCPACGSADVRHEDTRQRVVATTFGTVPLVVHRQRCRACRHRFLALGEVFATLGSGNTTTALASAAATAGSSWPFVTAARLLGELLGASISPEQVRHLTHAAGQRLADTQCADAQAEVSPSAERVRAERAVDHERTRHGSRSVDAPAPPAWCWVGLDGGWVASREQPGGMEGKVAVVATGTVALGPGRQALCPRRLVATFAPARDLGELAYTAAAVLGGTHSPIQLVLGDGAEWIKQQAARHFPAATGILDWSHLTRVIVRAVRAALPGVTQRTRRREVYQAVTDALWQGAGETARTLLVAVRDPARPCPAVEDALTYLETQRDWLGNYAAWRAAGYPVGSGLIERAVAIVINWRMKNRGMRWRRDSATAIVALRTERLNRDWETTMAEFVIAA